MTAEQKARLRALVMSGDQGGIVALWQEVQQGARSRGEAHFDSLIDPVTDEVVATLD
jgi:hypothetical protein